MDKKTSKKPVKKLRKRIVRRNIGKTAKPIDKNKLAFQEIRKDIKRLKKSKQRMQFLWYRTKKEHVALIKNLDKRIKKFKAEIKKKKPVKKSTAEKQILRKLAAKKRVIKKKLFKKPTVQKKIIRSRREKEVSKNVMPPNQSADIISGKEQTKE